MLKVIRQITTTRRRRGAVRCLITDLLDVDHFSLQHFAQRLKKSDVSFKEFHFVVLDQIDEVEQYDEHAVLDEHDNKVADANAHIQQLLAKT